MIDGKPRSASVVAIADCWLSFFSRAKFRTCIDSHPELTTYLVRTLARRLREADEALAVTTFLSVKGRLARALMISQNTLAIVGSPVYFGNVSGEVKVFLDNWFLKFGVFRDAKMRNKVAGSFVTGAAISNGKETAMQAIHAALLMNQMVIISAGGAFGAYGASATTGPDSPGIDDKKLEAARALGKRVAEFAAVIQRGSKI